MLAVNGGEHPMIRPRQGFRDHRASGYALDRLYQKYSCFRWIAQPSGRVCIPAAPTHRADGDPVAIQGDASDLGAGQWFRHHAASPEHHGHSDRDQNRPYHCRQRSFQSAVASITSDALITTWISLPSAMPRSFTASVVIIEVMIWPPPISTWTWLLTGPSFRSRTRPLSTFLALIFILCIPWLIDESLNLAQYGRLPTCRICCFMRKFSAGVGRIAYRKKTYA